MRFQLHITLLNEVIQILDRRSEIYEYMHEERITLRFSHGAAHKIKYQHENHAHAGRHNSELDKEFLLIALPVAIPEPYDIRYNSAHYKQLQKRASASLEDNAYYKEEDR